MSRYTEISQFRKSFDVITNWVYYPIASYLCTLFSYTSITPNQVTVLAIISELCAIYFILAGFELNLILIIVLLQCGYIFDLSDGMLARYKKTGYYHPEKPSIKGYYLDSVSDHILRFILFGSLVYTYSIGNDNGWLLGLLFLIIHGILQTEHSLRLLISNNNTQNRPVGIPLLRHLALLHNNIYLYYLIFIPLNRLDLFFIFYGAGGLILFIKRTSTFWLQND